MWDHCFGTMAPPKRVDVCVVWYLDVVVVVVSLCFSCS